MSLAPIALILLAPTLLLWRVIFLGDVFLPADLLRDIVPWRDPAHLVPWNPIMWDGIAEFYPWRLFYSRTLHQGLLPFWNPHEFCGTPFLANGQSAVLYPLNLLFVLFPVVRAFGISVWLHLALTGLFMYGFLRSSAVSASRAAATVGSLAWQLSTWQTSWLALPTFLCVSAWLPLALWLTSRLVSRPTAARAVSLAIVLGLIVLAGHLQIALYCFGLTTAYALFLAIPALRLDNAKRTPIITCFALTVVLTAGLAAPQLLPTLELSRVSHRAGAPVSASGYNSYIKLAMPGINLLTLYLPGVFGNPTDGTYWGIGTNGGPSAYVENSCYVGILALFLVFAGVIARLRTQSQVRFFMVTAMVALLLALGTPLDRLPFWTIPGFAQSGSPARVLVLWTFCASVLAGIGVDALLSLSRQQWIAALSVFIGTLTLCLFYAVLWINANAPAGTLTANISRESDLWRLPAGIILGTLLAFGLYKRGTLSRHVFHSSLICLVMLDLLAANGGYNRTCRPQDVYPVTAGIAFLQRNTGSSRIMPINRLWSLYEAPHAVLPPNSATVYNLSETQGYDSLLTRRAILWAADLNSGPPTPLENGNMVFTNGYLSSQTNDASVRYVISDRPLPQSSKLSFVLADRAMYIYENKACLPYIRSSEGSVIIADQWYPGWLAQLEGSDWEAIKGNSSLFRVIPLQSSNNAVQSVEMKYSPAAFHIGLYFLCLTAAFITAVTVIQTKQWSVQRQPVL